MPETFDDLEIYFDAEGEAQFVTPPPTRCHTIDVGLIIADYIDTVLSPIDDKAEYFAETIKTIRFLAALDWSRYAKNT
ncbi:MAG: hypothetical protein IPK63_15595 [Candidatus Competibacteraceae bacterium]|nr:hypothetical protein [Candidatus Competibacteraceae bacterium]